jgi:hypothetical protein
MGDAGAGEGGWGAGVGACVAGPDAHVVSNRVEAMSSQARTRPMSGL